MKIRELLALAKPEYVTKGKNLQSVAWHDGYLLVMFRERNDRYIFGPNVAEVEKAKLLRSLYPDSLFNKLKVKHGWQCVKVEVKR